MPEWTVTASSLFILESDWNRKTAYLSEFAQALERIAAPIELGFHSPEEVASVLACAVLGLKVDPQAHCRVRPDATGERFTEEWHDWMGLLLGLVKAGALSLYDCEGLPFRGPFEEGRLSSAELSSNTELLTLPKRDGRQFARRIRVELFKPGYALRTSFDPVTGTTRAAWEPVGLAEAKPVSGLAIEPPESLSWAVKPSQRDRDITADLVMVLEAARAAGKKKPPSAIEVVNELAARIENGEALQGQTSGIEYGRSGDKIGLRYFNRDGRPAVIDLRKLQKRIDRLVVDHLGSSQ